MEGGYPNGGRGEAIFTDIPWRRVILNDCELGINSAGPPISDVSSLDIDTLKLDPIGYVMGTGEQNSLHEGASRRSDPVNSVDLAFGLDCVGVRLFQRLARYRKFRRTLQPSHARSVNRASTHFSTLLPVPLAL
jgi:hypothetical protein